MMEFRYQSDRWAMVPDPLAMTQALMQDLNHASAQLEESENTDIPPENVMALRSAAWATLSL